MKNTILGYFAVILTLLIFSAIAFVIPVEHDATFWILYSFTAYAILSQIVVWHIAFDNAKTAKKKFFGIPIANLSLTYLILQFFVFGRCISIPNFPAWIALIICCVLFGVVVLGIIGAEVSRDEINRVENKVQQKTFFIKNLVTELQILAEKESDFDTKKALEELKDAVKYSDPMSNEALFELENVLISKIKDIQNSDNKNELICEIKTLLVERNNKCKLLK